MEAAMEIERSVEGASTVHETSIGPATSLSELKEALLLSYMQCSELGLIYSANWYVGHVRGHVRGGEGRERGGGVSHLSLVSTLWVTHIQDWLMATRYGCAAYVCSSEQQS